MARDRALSDQPQGSILAEGQYGTAASDDVEEPAGEDYAATIMAIAVQLWRGHLIFFLRMRMAELEDRDA